MMRRWFRHFACAARSSGVAMFALGLSRPEHMALFLGPMALHQIEGLHLMVLGVA
jgi:hypothetical protein